MELRLNRSLDDIPAQASDAELLEWAAELTADGSTPERPREPVKLKRRAPAEAESTRMSDEELFTDIFDRAAAFSGARGE